MFWMPRRFDKPRIRRESYNKAIRAEFVLDKPRIRRERSIRTYTRPWSIDKPRIRRESLCSS